MKEERKVVVTSLFINVLVIFAKIFSGLVFGSYTLIVGGYYTLCNFTSDFLGFSSSLVRGRKASKKEPFGYGKLPMYAMSSYGLIIVLVGLFVLIKAFFLKYDYIDLRIILPIMVIVFSLFVFAKILFKKGKDVQSEMLMDITHDTYFDGIISVIGIFFIVLGSFMPIFDLLGVIFVSLLIINKGIKIIVDNILLVKGQNDLSKKIIKAVESSMKECDGIYYSNCNLINVRNYYKAVVEVLVDDEVILSDLIMWEEYVKGKIKSLKFGIKMVDFLIYKNF